MKKPYKRRIEGEQHDIKEHFLVEESYQRERGEKQGTWEQEGMWRRFRIAFFFNVY
jgi:hypothetical protein